MPHHQGRRTRYPQHPWHRLDERHHRDRDLWNLTDDTLRCSELQARLTGITPKVLSERLAGLTRRGLLAREVSIEFPREVTYRLTSRVQALGRLSCSFMNGGRRRSGGGPSLVRLLYMVHASLIKGCSQPRDWSVGPRGLYSAPSGLLQFKSLSTANIWA
ncbi:transcriptional regulator [Paracoccus onubensis]|uniref:Transcriptional regulator n=1 Tax=Paracoccus onubensis TaxID=1675788 RepID=A0A418ST90_9RHOB|nr:transcriptional regulator [Paracoccus onubensis]